MFNPFLYVDPSGYTWFSKLGNWFRNNWESIVTTVVTVAVGVAVGAAVVASCGTAAPLLVAVCAGTAAGFAGGVTSGILSGQDLGGVMKSGLIGAGTGLVSGALGGVASAVAPAGALWGSLYGAGTGAVIGGVGSVMTGGDIKEGIIFGAATGLVGGGIQGYCSAKSQGLNPWTGTKLPEKTVNTPNVPFEAQAEMTTTGGEIRTEIKNATYSERCLEKISGADGQHNWNDYTVDLVIENGEIFSKIGDDGRTYVLVQQLGKRYGFDGVYEILYSPEFQQITHQRFVPGGIISGGTNQHPNIPNSQKSVSPGFKWWK